MRSEGTCCADRTKTQLQKAKIPLLQAIFMDFCIVTVKVLNSYALKRDANINEFKRHDKTRFTSDSFIEAIEFDYLEIHVIEE